MADAIPMLLLLHDKMALVIEDTPVTSEADSDDSDSEDEDINRPTPAVIRIASQAAVLIINKYLDLMWDCDIYIMAIGQLFLIFNILLVPTLRCFFLAMCPDRKLAWFKNKLCYSNEQMWNLKSIIVRAWKKYAPEKPEGSQHQKKDKNCKAALVYSALNFSNIFYTFCLGFLTMDG